MRSLWAKNHNFPWQDTCVSRIRSMLRNLYKISILLKKFRNWIALISTHLLGQLLISSVFGFSRFTFEMEVTNRRCQTNPPPPKKEKKNRSSPLTTNGTTTAVRTTAPIRHNARLLHVIRFRKRENAGSREDCRWMKRAIWDWLSDNSWIGSARVSYDDTTMAVVK